MVRLALDGLSLILLVSGYSSIHLKPNAFIQSSKNWMDKAEKMNNLICYHGIQIQMLQDNKKLN